MIQLPRLKRTVRYSLILSSQVSALLPNISSGFSTTAAGAEESMSAALLPAPLPSCVHTGKMRLPEKSALSRKLLTAMGVVPHQLGYARNMVSYCPISGIFCASAGRIPAESSAIAAATVSPVRFGVRRRAAYLVKVAARLRGKFLRHARGIALVYVNDPAAEVIFAFVREVSYESFHFFFPPLV